MKRWLPNYCTTCFYLYFFNNYYYFSQNQGESCRVTERNSLKDFKQMTLFFSQLPGQTKFESIMHTRKHFFLNITTLNFFVYCLQSLKLSLYNYVLHKQVLNWRTKLVLIFSVNVFKFFILLIKESTLWDQKFKISALSGFVLQKNFSGQHAHPVTVFWTVSSLMLYF